jgi:hypothetical protein
MIPLPAFSPQNIGEYRLICKILENKVLVHLLGLLRGPALRPCPARYSKIVKDRRQPKRFGFFFLLTIFLCLPISMQPTLVDSAAILVGRIRAVSDWLDGRVASTVHQIENEFKGKAQSEEGVKTGEPPSFRDGLKSFIPPVAERRLPRPVPPFDVSTLAICDSLPSQRSWLRELNAGRRFLIQFLQFP